MKSEDDGEKGRRRYRKYRLKKYNGREWMRVEESGREEKNEEDRERIM